MNYSSIIKRCDLLSPAFTLKINSKDRIQCVFGGFVSIATFLASFIISMYFVTITFSREKATTSFNQETEENPFFNLTQTPIAISVFGSGLDKIPNMNSIVDVQALFFEFRNLTYNITPISISKCNVSHLGEDLSSYNAQMQSIMLCVDTVTMKDRPIYGLYGDMKNSFAGLGIAINRCVNKTGNKICKPKEIIDQWLTGARMSIIMRDYNIDHRNYSTPGSPYLNSFYFRMSTDFLKRSFINFGNIGYISDNGYVFQDLTLYDYWSVKSLGEVMDGLDGKMASDQYSLLISCDKTRTVYVRNYMKIQDLLANIGGIIKGITVIATLFENYFVYKISIIALAEMIFLPGEPKSSYDSPLSTVAQMNHLTQTQTQMQNQLPIINNLFHGTAKDTSVISEGKRKTEALMRYIVFSLFTFSSNRLIKMTFLDYILPVIVRRTKGNITTEKAKEYFNRQISIERIIKKLKQFDKFKHIVFSEDEKNVFKLIKKEYVSKMTVNEKKMSPHMHPNQKTKKYFDSLVKLTEGTMKTPIQERLIQTLMNVKSENC